MNSISAGNGGFIVSHNQFDDATPYNKLRHDTLTLTGLSNNSTLHLTIVTFDLRYSRPWWRLWQKTCEDYLEISSIGGFPNNKAKHCGYQDLAGTTHNLFPVNNKTTFTFVTKGKSRSTGFRLKYEGSFNLLYVLDKPRYLYSVIT